MAGTEGKKKFGLAGWAIWAMLFTVLSLTLVGGAIGGAVAGVAAFGVLAVLPARPDGEKLSRPVSIALLLLAVAIFVAGHVLRLRQ